jgi:stage IV sporulation protein FB
LPESLLSRRLKLGKYLGIELYVHWSFALLVLYVALSTRGDGMAVMGFAISQLLGVFLCVTLHEYGHAMAARAFGIGTADITLLPIGGVARLQRMPRIPWQELVVAVAGPAVNVVIALLLLIGFVSFVDGQVVSALGTAVLPGFFEMPVDEEMAATLESLFTLPSLAGFVLVMLVVNVMLVLFNMIPAFPMDGGRVFRSVMAMLMEYRKATWLASRVGLVCAFLMVLLALGIDPANPIPILIAVFIGYAGFAEARQVDLVESVRGLVVGQVMIRSNLQLPMDLTLAEIIHYWRNLTVPALPVTSMVGTPVGMLSLREVAEAVESGMDLNTTAGQLVNHDKPSGTVRVSELLESALMRVGKLHRQVPVVDDSGLLVGILDFDSMLIRRALSPPDESIPWDTPSTHFDQVS